MKTVYQNEHKFIIKDLTKDYHTQYGVLKKEDFEKPRAKTNKDKELIIFDSTFIDKYEKIKRGAQIITQKDIGIIISETGINKNSIVLEAGSGSGSLTAFLANICKKVYSFDIRQDHQDIAKKNIEMLELKNVVFNIFDIREENKLINKNKSTFDLVCLDMPDPWNALKNSKTALKRGGYLVVYSPTIPQVMDLIEKLKADFNDDFLFLKTIENIQRPWEINERKVRPVSSYINHTAFLSFIRRI
jgi:tRNA (adenine57-N1/adenine58-N1)-methyltransferase catalytic subunit